MDPFVTLAFLSFVFAIYPVIPKEKRLDIKLRLSTIDYITMLIGILLIHYIFFYSILNKFGFTLKTGIAEYGFKQKTITYLILLFLSLFVYIRVKRAKIKNSNIKQFSELFEELLFEKKYYELSSLINDHLVEIERIASNSIKPMISIPLLNQFFKKQKSEESLIATAILRRLLNSQEFTNFLALSKPYLCIKILELNNDNNESFLQLYVEALIEDKGSIYYYELEHTCNYIKGNRFKLSSDYKLLYYLFNNVKVSENLAVYKPVGEKVCDLLKKDKKLIDQCNKSYQEYEKNLNTCPISSSLHFFEIMIIESMHQKIQWHMWLYYFTHFTEKILESLNPDQQVDLDKEWPTVFHYFLYQIVTIQLDWLKEYNNVEDKEFLSVTNLSLSHDNGSITKSTVLSLADTICTIIKSKKITDKFKIYLIEIVARYIETTKHNKNYTEINELLIKAIVRSSFYNKTDSIYVNKLSMLYKKIDYFIRANIPEFEEQLAAAQTEIGQP